VEVSKELSGIQAWLSPLEPSERHQDVSDGRLNGVGDWFYRGTSSGHGARVRVAQ